MTRLNNGGRAMSKKSIMKSVFSIILALCFFTNPFILPVYAQDTLEVQTWKETTQWTREYLPDYNDEYAIQSMYYLVDYQGFSKYGAAGIVGNIYAECRFDPKASNGTHIGIMQWDWKARWPKVSKWLKENKLSEDNYYGQLIAVFDSDDAKNYSKVFEKMQTMSNEIVAADYWQIMYEGAEGQSTGPRELGARLALALYELDSHGISL